MNILLVEDEAAVVSLIKRSLGEQGMNVSVALDGSSGLSMAREHSFDVMILDIMLPGINGVELCKTLRRDHIQTPILMLTALGSTENIVTGLDAGADDYLSKPFKLTELHARLRALARRKVAVSSDDNFLEFGGIRLNTASKSLTRDGQQISLTATELKLLEFFLRNPNRVLSRVEILEHVWDIDFNLGTNVVDVYVNYLRKKIDKNFENKLIQTMVGLGYILKLEDA
ncbi:MAG: response regulator transcription factor [Chitinophagaceae bacterium]|nr:MAG: response regulator transcription factor [Chitinophagaceae bacterium]